MTDLSPARLQMMWNRLLAVVEEQRQVVLEGIVVVLLGETAQGCDRSLVG